MRIVTQVVLQNNQYFLFYIYKGRQGRGSIIIGYIVLLTICGIYSPLGAAEAAAEAPAAEGRKGEEEGRGRADDVMGLRFDKIHFYGI